MIKKFAFLAMCCTSLCANDLTWGLPTVLSTLGENAKDPRIGIDTNGNLVAAWIENDVVMSSTQPFHGSWTTPATQVSDSGATSLQLVVDKEGNSTAIWNQYGVIQSSTLPLNGTWSAPQELSPNAGDTPPSEIAASPQISVDSSGNVLGVWEFNGVIQAVAKQVNQDWSPTTTISYPYPSSDSPQVALGGDNSIVAVWHSTWDGIDVIYSSSTKIGEAWPTYPTLISDKNIPSAYPQVAVNSEGNPIAAWYAFDREGDNYANVRVQTALGYRHGTWSCPYDLSSPGIKDPKTLALDIAFNQKDMALVLWTNSYDFSTFNLEGSVYTPNGWIPTVTIVCENTNLYDQNFLISPSSYAYAAYMAYDSSTTLPAIRAFKVNTENDTLNYGNILTVSRGGSNSHPMIDGTSVDLAHAVGAIWLNYDGDHTVVQASVGKGAALTAPESLTATQKIKNYGDHLEYYNTLNWTSSSPDSCSNWVIFRNGTMVKTLPITTMQYIDHNLVYGQSVTYGVALQSEDGDMSSISMISIP